MGELTLVLLERVGYSDFQNVKRPGTHGAELHLSARLSLPHGEYRVAVVIRRDGREIGRERVTELRGALHHYGPAQLGCLITTGQALSGARDEAAAPQCNTGESHRWYVAGADLRARGNWHAANDT